MIMNQEVVVVPVLIQIQLELGVEVILSEERRFFKWRVLYRFIPQHIDIEHHVVKKVCDLGITSAVGVHLRALVNFD
jgi:hypothetical protein